MHNLTKIVAILKRKKLGLNENLKISKRSSITFEDGESRYQKDIEENKDVIKSLRRKLKEVV